jgi:hypothetical protein
MKKILIELPDELIKLSKKAAVDKDMPLKSLVAEALRRYLGIKEGGESGKK